MKIKLLSPEAKVPTKGTPLSAGYDLYTPKDVIIAPGRNLVPVDIAIELPSGTEGHIRPRSGFSLKGFEGHAKLSDGSGYDSQPSRFDADVIQGTIDEDYRGNVGVIVKSFEEEEFLVAKGTRIAQMVIGHPIELDSFEVVESLERTERGQGGFNSTGTH